MKTRQAWWEAAKLFWQRPVLSLPVLAAAFAPFLIYGLGHWLMRWMLPPPVDAYGAYGVHPPLSQILLQGEKAEWNAYWPLLSAEFLAQGIICAIALFVTAGALRRTRTEEPSAVLRHGLMFAGSRRREVMWLSLAGSAAFFLYEAVHYAVFYCWVTYLFRKSVESESFGHIETLMLLVRDFGVPMLYAFLSCIAAWLLTGMAMRGIGAESLQEISQGKLRRGKRLAIVTVLLSAALAFALRLIREMVIPAGGLVGTVAEWELNAVQAVIVAFPYALLFIALTRIVDQYDDPF